MAAVAYDELKAMQAEIQGREPQGLTAGELEQGGRSWPPV